MIATRRAKLNAFAGVEEPDPDCGTDEQSLAAAVVQRAIDDALATRKHLHGGTSSTLPTPTEHDEAVLFLTVRRGPWADARVAWCDAAGVNHVAVRDGVTGELERRAARKKPDRRGRRPGERVWTPEDDQTIRTMWSAGCRWDAIRIALGVTLFAAKGRWRAIGLVKPCKERAA